MPEYEKWDGVDTRRKPSFFERFTPANWIQITLILLVGVSMYWKMELRMNNQERWQIEQEQRRINDQTLFQQLMASQQKTSMEQLEIKLTVAIHEQRLGRLEKRMKID